MIETRQSGGDVNGCVKGGFLRYPDYQEYRNAHLTRVVETSVRQRNLHPRVSGTEAARPDNEQPNQKEQTLEHVMSFNPNEKLITSQYHILCA